MLVVMIRCQRYYYKEQRMVVVTEEDLVNLGRRHRGMDRPVDVVVAASRMIEVDWQSSQQMHLSEYSNGAWASSRLLVR